MATIRINGLEAHSSPMVLTSPSSALPDRASFKAIYERDDVFLAVMEGAAGPGAVESPRHFFKLANTSEGIFNLKNEHNIYVHQLAHLQGSAVPTCYGIFEGSGVDGQPIACLALEYHHSSPERYDTSSQRAAKREKLMDNIEQIHAAGVVLNHPQDALHYVGTWEDPRIIDFTVSYTHICPGFDLDGNATGTACEELSTFKKNYRRIQNGIF